MSWSSTATAVTGDVITASFWNTYGRDYLNKLAPAAITATLDFPYTSNGISFTKIANIAYDYMSVASSGSPTPHLHGCAALVYKSTFGVSITNGSKITFDTELFDNNSIADLVAHNDRLTIPVTGTYFVVAQVGLTTSSVKIPVVVIVRYNSGNTLIDYYGASNLTGNENSTNQMAHVSAIIDLTAGDYLTLENYADTFTTYQVVASSAFPSLSCIMIAG